MLSLLALLIAVLLFVLAGCGQTVFSQPPGDLIAFGLAFFAASFALTGYGPVVPNRRRE
jgi:hypothetical protein